jgi:hypothetical protein
VVERVLSMCENLGPNLIPQKKKKKKKKQNQDKLSTEALVGLKLISQTYFVSL